jgi:ABC-type transport system substrate-binding protein
LNKVKKCSGLSKILIVGLLIIGSSAWAAPMRYDGIWFMGMNMNKDLLKPIEVRQAINETINKIVIKEKVISAEAVPASIIPPGMLGYDPDLEPTGQDVKYAKLLMTKAGYPINDKRIKALSLLHTDGIKTVAIAKQIQMDLTKIGMKVNLVEIDFAEQEKWAAELASGKYDFFLMGYKAGIEEFFSTQEADAAQVDSYSLVEPLFATKGEANFTGYSNAKVDKWLDQLSNINPALKEERHKKLKQINDELYKDLPVVVLFYIEKI